MSISVWCTGLRYIYRMRTRETDLPLRFTSRAIDTPSVAQCSQPNSTLTRCESHSQCVSLTPPKVPLKLSLLHSIVYHIVLNLKLKIVIQNQNSKLKIRNQNSQCKVKMRNWKEKFLICINAPVNFEFEFVISNVLPHFFLLSTYAHDEKVQC